MINLKTLDLSANGLGSKGYIKKIEGLDSLTKLEALYLHDNEIGTVENINHLTNLQRLTLHHNKIKTLEGIPSLSAVTRLTAGNELDCFPDLRHYPLLEELGIMGNFKTIPNLNFLEHLHTVVIDGGHDTCNPEVVLNHKQLENVSIIGTNCFKGTVSPLFWTSDNKQVRIKSKRTNN